jgi:hypothetical protein
VTIGIAERRESKITLARKMHLTNWLQLSVGKWKWTQPHFGF